MTSADAIAVVARAKSALAAKNATIDMQSQAITALQAKNADLEAKLAAVTDAVPDAVATELSSLDAVAQG